METIDTRTCAIFDLLGRIKMNCMGIEFEILYSKDKEFKDSDRRFIQLQFTAPCAKTGIVQEWKSRKYYLSKHMTDDEIVKTVYTAYEAAIRHELMEGFKVDGKILFNPHINFEALLKIADEEVTREPAPNNG